MSMDRMLQDALTEVAGAARSEPDVGDLMNRFDRRVRQRRTRRIAISAGSIVTTVALIVAAAGTSRANNAVQVDREHARHDTKTTLENDAAAPSRRADGQSTTTTTSRAPRASVPTITSPRSQSPTVQIPVGPQLPSDPGITPTTMPSREPSPSETTTTTTLPPSNQFTAWATGFRAPSNIEAMNADPSSCNALLGASTPAVGVPDGNAWSYTASPFSGCTNSQPQIAVAEFPYLQCANVSAISSFEIVIVTSSGQIATTMLQFKVIPAIDSGPYAFSTTLSMAFPAGAHTSTLGPFTGFPKDNIISSPDVVTLLSFDPGVAMSIDAIGIRYHGDLSGCTPP